MKKGIHPENYRLVAFKDMSNDHVFLCRSAVSTKETIEVNGETYPVYKMEISNTANPFLFSFGTRFSPVRIRRMPHTPTVVKKRRGHPLYPARSCRPESAAYARWYTTNHPVRPETGQKNFYGKNLGVCGTNITFVIY